VDQRAAVPNAKATVYVTDGPELFRTQTGGLLMLWASYEKNSLGFDSYVETVARSKTGELKGPWEQLPPLVRNDSGHGMLFRTFAGQLMLVLHQPFTGRTERFTRWKTSATACGWRNSATT